MIVVACRNPIREEISRCRIYIPLLCTPSDPKIRVAAGIFRSNAVMEPRLHCRVALRRTRAVAGVEPRLVLGIQAGSGRVGYFVIDLGVIT